MIGNRMPPDEMLFVFGGAINVLALAEGNKE